MPRAPVFIPRQSTVEVTIRCFQGRMLLRPDEDVTEHVLSVLGHALRMFPVRVHAFTFLSNHVHLLLTVDDAHQLAGFLRILNKQIGDIIRVARRWEGTAWDGRPSYAVVVTDEASLARLEYVCSNGVKEGLVDHPLEWPGASSARALVAQQPILTRWQGSELRARARRDGVSPAHPAYWEYNRIELAPLPALAHLSADERRGYFRELFDRIAARARAERGGRRALGKHLLRAVDPLERRPLDRTYASTRGPLVHGQGQRRRAHVAEWEAFVASFRHASLRLARLELDVEFPPGCFPPRRPFVPWPAAPQPHGR